MQLLVAVFVRVWLGVRLEANLYHDLLMRWSGMLSFVGRTSFVQSKRTGYWGKCSYLNLEARKEVI